MTNFLSILKEKLEPFQLGSWDEFGQRLDAMTDELDAFGLLSTIDRLIPNVILSGSFIDGRTSDANESSVYVEYYGHYDGHDSINVDFLGPEGEHKTYLSTEHILSVIKTVENALATNTLLSTIHLVSIFDGESEVIFKHLDSDEPELYLAGIKCLEFKNAEEIALVLACLVANVYSERANTRGDVLLEEAIALENSKN